MVADVQPLHYTTAAGGIDSVGRSCMPWGFKQYKHTESAVHNSATQYTNGQPDDTDATGHALPETCSRRTPGRTWRSISNTGRLGPGLERKGCCFFSSRTGTCEPTLW